MSTGPGKTKPEASSFSGLGAVRVVGVACLPDLTRSSLAAELFA